MSIEIEEKKIPVHEEVRGACELLGLDPLYVANEGKLVAIVAPEARRCGFGGHARATSRGEEAAIIGDRCRAGGQCGLVTMRTAFGSSRIVDLLPGDQLPRIC